MKFTYSSLFLSSGLLAATQVMAGDLLLWQTNSLSYLYGKDFAVNPSIQQTITFEHADRWKYGDNFLFVDSTYYNGEKDRNKGVHAYYGEFSPRLSFGKILDRRFEFGPIKDVLLAMTYENGSDDANPRPRHRTRQGRFARSPTNDTDGPSATSRFRWSSRSTSHEQLTPPSLSTRCRWGLWPSPGR